MNYSSYFVDAPHYWPEAALPIAYAMACVEVVARRNKKASKIYRKIVEAWGHQGVYNTSESIFSEVPDYEEKIKEAFIHPEKEFLPDPNKPFKDLEKNIDEIAQSILDESLLEKEGTEEIKSEEEKDFDDMAGMISLIFEFIIVGFNRESDIEKGIFKVSMGDTSFWLIQAIEIRTSLEYYNITLEKIRNYYKMRKYKGKVLDFHDILTNQPMSRWHRRIIAAGKAHKLKLKNDRIFVDAAEQWYKCRILYPSINKYCEAQSKLNEKVKLDEKNIYKQIKPCDEALGYQGRIKKRSD
jgi:hypothetical protein